MTANYYSFLFLPTQQERKGKEDTVVKVVLCPFIHSFLYYPKEPENTNKLVVTDRDS